MLGEIELKVKEDISSALTPFQQADLEQCHCECFSEKVKMATLYFNMALITNDAQLFQKSAEYFSDVKECTSQSDSIFYNLGLISLLLHDEHLAGRYFEKAQTAGTSQPQIFEILAFVYANLGEYDRADTTLSLLAQNVPADKKSRIEKSRDLIKALQFWSDATGLKDDVYRFPNLSPYLLSSIASSSVSGKFHFHIKPGPEVDITFSVGDSILFMSDGFEIYGKTLNFGKVSGKEKKLLVRLMANEPFVVQTVETDTNKKCLKFEVNSDENNQTWLISVHLQREGCKVKNIKGLVHVKTDLINHPTIDIKLHGTFSQPLQSRHSKVQ